MTAGQIMIKRAIGFGFTGITKLIYEIERARTRRKARRFGSKYHDVALDLTGNPRMLLDTEDRGVSDQLRVRRMREHENVQSFIRLLTSERFTTIIEVGANIGFFAVLEANYGTFDRMIAVEPVPENFELLKLNALLNGIYNRTYFKQCAVGDKNGIVKLGVPEERNLAGLTTPADGVNRAVTVRMVTLEELFKGHDFPRERVLIRFDIEGAEKLLIPANIDFLKSLHDSWLVFEFHPFLMSQGDALRVIDTLEGAGFKLDRVVTTYYHWIYVGRRLEGFSKKMYRWFRPNAIFGEHNPTWSEFKENLAKGRYVSNPHLYVHIK